MITLPVSLISGGAGSIGATVAVGGGIVGSIGGAVNVGDNGIGTLVNVGSKITSSVDVGEDSMGNEVSVGINSTADGVGFIPFCEIVFVESSENKTTKSEKQQQTNIVVRPQVPPTIYF